VIAQEQARALHALGMVDYGEMKARLMLTTAALVAGGSTICWIHGDAGVLLLMSPSADLTPDGDRTRLQSSKSRLCRAAMCRIDGLKPV